MAKVSVYNIEGKEVGTIDLNDAVFGERIGKSNSEYFRILSGKMQLLCHQLT